MKIYKANRKGFINYLLIGSLILPIIVFFLDKSTFTEKPFILLPLLSPFILIFWIYFDTFYKIEKNRLLKTTFKMEEDNTMNGSNFVMGDFVDRAHPTSGKAAVNSDKTELTFTNFKTDNGPKLLVYLSTDTNATEYIDLGDLKGISGDFTYSIPANTDVSKYKLVNIWCVDFSVSFGTAELK